MTDFIIPFLSGGFIVSGIKYTTTIMNNTKLAAIIGAFPIGLFSIYFLNPVDAYTYGYNYSIMIGILFISAVVFNFLYKVVRLSKNISHVLALLTWFILALLRYSNALTH